MNELTDEQELIVNANDSFMSITAYAGTGKTSTLRAFAEKRPYDHMLYLAFNRALADEAKKAFYGLKNVEVRTLHSLAFANIGHKYRENLGNYRVMDLEEYLGSTGIPKNMGVARVLFDSINSWMLSDDKTIAKFMKKYSHKIAENIHDYRINKKSLTQAVQTVWKDMVDGNFTISHNGYFKLFQLASPPLDYYKQILVDEAQDLNDAMINVIFGFSGKKILVGDPYQQIYGWNGAVDALAKAEKKGANSYYLTHSFRCPSNIASIANNYLKLLGAKKTFYGFENPNNISRNDYPPIVIARTNASIFDYAARNMNRAKIHYKGGFDGYQFDIISDINNLRTFKERVTDPFIKKFKSYDDLDKYVKDAEDTIMKVRLDVERKYGSKVHSIYHSMRLKQAPNENEADVIITTAHKVKGQEFGSVTLLDDFVELNDVISRGLKSEENPQNNPPVTVSREEFQLLYVAITRSFDQLDIPKRYYIDTNSIISFKNLVKKKHIILV
jgi:superfamily I DNA/RNA helicase